MSRNLIYILSGPTASGKTASAIKLAMSLPHIEIVNFDSLLFYKELNIGTAKPTENEIQKCPHHLIDIASIKSPLNAADFAKLALKKIIELHKSDKIVILTGGSGFYLQALLYGMFDSENTDEKTRLKSDRLYSEQGIAPFRKILEQVDKDSYEIYHENDHYRIRRAVEHFWIKGSPFSLARQVMMNNRAQNSNIKKYNWNVFHAHLDLPKEQHYQIIQTRTNNMLNAGLIEEVEALLAKGHSGFEKPLQSIGYKETLQYLKQELQKDELSERINISTRQLAKSQRTWFKKTDKSVYNPLKDFESLLNDFKGFVERT